VILLIVRLLL
jgi:uncharacterized membrane protein YhaH (DUF805 family)